MTEIVILDSSYFYIFPGKSIPGEVLALSLHLGVFGAGHGPNQSGPGSWLSENIFNLPI